ncbi:MAG: hypothetical protein KOO63_05400 [Bacteroidales bacterium]|nr:hypothetical protein [Candidatus Latescibacterota bacterium]
MMDEITYIFTVYAALAILSCAGIAAYLMSRQAKRHRKHVGRVRAEEIKNTIHCYQRFWGSVRENRERIAAIRCEEVFPLLRIRTSLVHQLKHSAEERHRLIGEVQRYRNMAGVAGDAYGLMINECRLGLSSSKSTMRCLRDIQEIIHNASAMLAAQEVVSDEGAKQAAIKVEKKRVGSSRKAKGRRGAGTAKKG